MKTHAAKPATNSIVRALLEGHGSFSRFLKVVHEISSNGSGPRTPSNSHQEGSVSIFPSLLVVPELGRACGSRRNRRRRGRGDTWEHVRILWCFFTFLEGGCPFKHSAQVSLARRASLTVWTDKHSAYAGYLHDEIHKFGRLKVDDTLSRGLQELNKMVTLVRNSQYSPGPYSAEELQTVAKAVKPDRMSLPDVAGIIDPADHLKGDRRKTFVDMINQIPHDIVPENPTKGCFMVDPSDVVEVYSKLLNSGVATLIPVDQALKDSEGNIISGGLFAVPHKPQTERIICDRRPINELERRLVWAKLPHGSLLTQIILPKEYSLRGSGDDLSNYFYLLHHRPEWVHRNCVGRVVNGSDFVSFGYDPSTKYLLAFTVIPMGDLNAVDIAQETHVEILRDAGCLRSDEVLAYGTALPARHCIEGLYIDDHITMQLVPKRRSGRTGKSRFRDNEVVEQSRARYNDLGIPTSSKKAFSYQMDFQAWGTEVNSSSGRVGTPLTKLKQLSNLIGQVCSLKVVGKKLLQRVLGLFVHPCMHQRLLMCLLQDSYTWVEKLDERCHKKLPNSVREELLTLALALPLCHSNIRWPVSNRISATDASLKGGGQAATLTTPSIAQTLYRFSVHRGESVRLDWIHGQLAPPSEMQPAPESLENLMQAHVWNTTGSCKFAHKQHINVLEMKMLKRELMDLVQHDCEPARVVVLIDSRVVAGAFGKGRSSSRQLNRILRSMLGWSLVGRRSLHLLWVQSSMNPSDHPSRGARIPPPPSNPAILKEIFGSDVPDIQTRKSNKELRNLARVGVKESNHQDDAEDIVKKEDDPSFTKNPCVCPDSVQHPAQSSWTFREIFAGCAALTQVFMNKKKFKVGAAVELIQRNKPDKSHDLTNDQTFKRLCQDAKRPRQIWHFGLPCASFSLMQNMNGGTRSSNCPEGSGVLEREIVGNLLAYRTFFLCLILHAHGNFFTIENPLTSHVWNLKKLRQLVEETQAKFVRFDQCMYGLKIPLSDDNWGLAKKATCVLGTLPGIDKLACKCDKSHNHVQVIGGVKVGGRWTRRSTLAGRYPLKLCQKYYQCCDKLFR